MNHDQSKQRELLDKIRKIISEETAKHLGRNLDESTKEPFSPKEAREIDQATKKMSDFLTDKSLDFYYYHFNFRGLNKYDESEKGEIEYEFSGRYGSVQFVWTKERGKISMQFSSTRINDARGSMVDFPLATGSNVKQVTDRFMHDQKVNQGHGHAGGPG